MADTAHRPNGSGTKRRFSEEDSEQFVQNHVSKKTKDVTRYAVSILREFCFERGLQETFKLLSESDLCTLLKDFFTNVRNKKGELYSKSSICAIRQGIRRYLQEPPHNKTFDIINDPVFKGANQVFISMLKMTRAEGKGTVTHKKAIPAGDLQKLYSHHRAFNTDVPKGILNKVTFAIIFFFCRRGKENIRELKPSDFQVKTDDNEQRYICKTTSEKTKNHTGVTDELEGTGARMYETKTAACPVLSFEKYLSKRNPKCDALLQYPRNQYCDADQVWYENRPLGKNAIGEFISNLSKESDLSDIYTNHCIRGTTITLLNESGFKDRDIISVSGHRNEKSLASYVSDTSIDTKRKMSEELNKHTNTINTLAPVRKPDTNGTVINRPTAEINHQFTDMELSDIFREDNVPIDYGPGLSTTQVNNQVTNWIYRYCRPNFTFNNSVVNFHN